MRRGARDGAARCGRGRARGPRAARRERRAASRAARAARPLTLAALALVLAAAALHAAWNALVANARDTHATTAVALVVGAAVFAVPAALTWRVESEAWPYIAASAALELAYFALLAAVYSRADLSFAYPVARGSAPVLVLLISVIALGAAVSLAAAAGVLAVTGGVLLVRGVGRGAPPTSPRSCSRSASARASRATRWSTTTASATRPRSPTSS